MLQFKHPSIVRIIDRAEPDFQKYGMTTNGEIVDGILLVRVFTGIPQYTLGGFSLKDMFGLWPVSISQYLVMENTFVDPTDQSLAFCTVMNDEMKQGVSVPSSWSTLIPKMDSVPLELLIAQHLNDTCAQLALQRYDPANRDCCRLLPLVHPDRLRQEWFLGRFTDVNALWRYFFDCTWMEHEYESKVFLLWRLRDIAEEETIQRCGVEVLKPEHSDTTRFAIIEAMSHRIIDAIHAIVMDDTESLKVRKKAFEIMDVNNEWRCRFQGEHTEQYRRIMQPRLKLPKIS
ncbi:MAG: hypothetical protein WC477_02805 [Patescibacteria group bacterium]